MADRFAEPPVSKPEVPIPERITAFYRPRKSVHDLSASSRSLDVSVSLVNRGLLNPTGENNCFLNSVVQTLWHIDVFRRSFREFKGHSCVGKSCIFCALKALFSQFQHGSESAIPPDVLRTAMASCYEGQHRFQLGLMDDAAECFEKILEQVHFHLTGDDDLDTCIKPFCLPHVKCSLTVLERTECICGATSEPLSFVQFVHYVSAPAIVTEAQKMTEITHGKNAQFGKILNAASCFGESRQCPNFSKCKRTVKVKRILLNCPDVVCLGLIWDSDCPSVEDLMSVVNTIGLNLQLTDVFDHVFVDSAQFNQYELAATIAYYGRHYSTFCFHSRMQEWIYFDDAKFRVIGSEWSDVVEQIRRGHYQPLLLVYTNPFADSVDIAEAPVEVSMMDNCHKKELAPIGEEGDDRSVVTSTQTGAGNEAEVIDTKESVPTSQNTQVSGNTSTMPLGKLPSAERIMCTTTDTTKDATSNKISFQNSSTKQSHQTLDPLTLCIVPTSHANNSPASIGPRPACKNPTTPDITEHITNDVEDLMTFSISPGRARALAMHDSQHMLPSAGKTLKPPAPGNSLNQHSAAQSGIKPVDDQQADLMQFSMSPLQMAHTKSKYGASPVLTHQHAQSELTHSEPIKLHQPEARQAEGQQINNIGIAQVEYGALHSGKSKATQSGARQSETLSTGRTYNTKGEAASKIVAQYSVGDWHVLSLREPGYKSDNGTEKQRINQSSSAVTSQDARLQDSTRKALSQAGDIWAKVEAIMGSDDVVALTLCTQYTGLLLKVLQDPVVAATPALKEQISTKRAEGFQMLETLRSISNSSSNTSSVFGECVQCGQKRSLKNSVCGPCRLRAKVNYPSWV